MQTPQLKQNITGFRIKWSGMTNQGIATFVEVIGYNLSRSMLNPEEQKINLKADYQRNSAAFSP
jgi:hypothetical protein